MSEWKMVRLGDIFDLQMGKTPDRNRPEYFNTNTNKWVSIADISKAQKYILETKECISDEAVKNSGIKQIPANTIIMSFKLSIGKTAITTEPMYSNEAIMAFLPNGKYEVDNNFFYHLFSNKNWSEGSNKAVKGVTLNKATLTEVKIPLPPIDEQKHIAAMLDKCADIIAKRKQQLSALDELVKARFVEMFGDPFCNPKQWKRINLKEAGKRLSDGPFGSNLKSEHYTDSGIRVIRLGNIGVGSFVDNDKSYISEKHYEELKKYTCKAGEIIIGTLGEPNLRACILPNEVGIAINKADCVHYIPKPEMLNNDFVCHYINCPETLLLAGSMIHGQTRSRVSSGQLAQIPIFIPPMELQDQFASFVAQTDKSKLAIQKSLEKTQLLFDSLMQEYFG